MQFLNDTIPLWTFLLAVVVFVGIMVYEFFYRKKIEDNLISTGYVLASYIERYGDTLVNQALERLAKMKDEE